MPKKKKYPPTDVTIVLEKKLTSEGLVDIPPKPDREEEQPGAMTFGKGPRPGVIPPGQEGEIPPEQEGEVIYVSPEFAPDLLPEIPDKDLLKLYEASEANEILNEQLLEQDEETGEVKSQVENVIPDGELDPDRPVMNRGANLTISALEKLIPEPELQAIREAGVMGSDALKSGTRIIGGSLEDSLHNSLKYLYGLTPDFFQDVFEQTMLGQKPGVLGITGTEAEFEQTRLFPHMGGVLEEVARGISTFAWGMKGAGIILNTKKLFVLRGAMADMVVFNPELGTLATLMRDMDWGPEVLQDLAAYIDSTEPGTETEKRLRMAVEGIILAGVFTGVITGIKHSPKAVREFNEWRKTFFGEDGLGRPAIDKVAELFRELKKKWDPNRMSFEEYLTKQTPDWRVGKELELHGNWPVNKPFNRYMAGKGWERHPDQPNKIFKHVPPDRPRWGGPPYHLSYYKTFPSPRTETGTLVFPRRGELTPKGKVRLRGEDGHERLVDDFKWRPDPDTPHFGLPPQPQTLPPGHRLLKHTHTIKTAARERLRKKIVKNAVKGAVTVKDRKPVAFLKAGGAASGKGAVDRLLRKEKSIKPGVTEVNADTYKAQLPEWKKFIDAGDARGANILHEESSDLVGRVTDELINKNADVVFDRVLGNPKKAKALIKKLHAAGYEVRLVGATVDPREAVIRAIARYTQTKRWVEISGLLRGHKNVSTHFDEYMDMVDTVHLYDNVGKEPREIVWKTGGKVEMLDEKSYNEFVKKGDVNEKADTLNEILPEPYSPGLADTPGVPRTDEGRGLVGDGQTPRSGSRGPEETAALAEVTSSPAFRTWFKNSKVVDEQGKPLVVYHGTSDSIHAFDLNHPNRHDTGWLGDGVYITTDSDLASSYSMIKRGGGAPNIMPLYVSIQNPYMATLETKLALRKYTKNEIREWTENLIKKGHDGVILEQGLGKREIVAFNPSQVKSAFNPGTFDPTRPEVMAGGLSLLGLTTPETEPEFQVQQAAWWSGFKKAFKPRKPINVNPLDDASVANEELKRFVAQHVDANMDNLDARSLDDIIEEAKTLRDDPLNVDPSTWDNSAMMVKVRLLAKGAALDAMEKIKKAAATGDLDDIQAAKNAEANMANLLQAQQQLQAGPARTTMVMGATLDPSDAIGELRAKNFTKIAINQALEVPDGYTDLQRYKIMAEATRHMSAEEWAVRAKDIIGWKDLFLAHMYPFMLSSLGTWGPLGANVLSNSLILLNYPMTKLAGAALSPVRRMFNNDKDRITWTEGFRSMAVLRQSLPESLRFAWETLLTNQPAGRQVTKLDQMYHASKGDDIVTADNLREMFENIHQNPAMKNAWFQKLITPKTVKEGGPFAIGAQTWGLVLSGPGRGLKGGDEFFKTFGRRLGQLDEAYRKAFRDWESGAINQGEIDEAVTQYLKNPTKKMNEAGEELAEFLTLQTKLGEFGEMMSKARDTGIAQWGLPWGRMTMPFMKVMVNLGKYSLHMVNLTKNSYADLKGLNGGAAQDMALGRFVVAGTYVTIGQLLSTGFWDNVQLHGYGASGAQMPDPEDNKAMKEMEMNAGFKPCSLVITDEDGGRHTVQFGQIEPLATFFCTVADISDNSEDIMEQLGQAEYDKLMMTAYAIMSNNLISKQWARSVHELLTLALTPTDRSARALDNFVRIVVPRILADFRTAAGDDEFREYQHAVDGFNGTWEVIKSQLPGLSKTLPGKKNIWNEPVFNHGKVGPDWLSVFRYSHTKPDIVDKEAYRLKIPMRNVSWRVEGVKLHPQVRNRWIELANPIERKAGEWFGKSMTKKEVALEIKGQAYAAADEDERVERLKRIINKRRNAAKKQLFNSKAPLDPVIAEWQPDLLTQIAENKERQKRVQEGVEGADYFNQMATPRTAREPVIPVFK